MNSIDLVERVIYYGCQELIILPMSFRLSSLHWVCLIRFISLIWLVSHSIGVYSPDVHPKKYSLYQYLSVEFIIVINSRVFEECQSIFVSWKITLLTRIYIYTLFFRHFLVKVFSANHQIGCSSYFRLC